MEIPKGRRTRPPSVTVELVVRDLTCEGCEQIVQSALSDVEGVDDSEVDHTTDTATVEGTADVDDLVQAVEMAGYEATAEVGSG